MRSRVRLGASLIAAVLLAACTPAPAPTSMPSPAPTAAPAASETVAPSPTTVAGVRAPSGVVTRATVIGQIWLGFEACVGLTPNAQSPYLPPFGQDDFVLVFPRGWEVVSDHPDNPLYGDHFRILDGDGRIVAEDGDILEAHGQIRAIEATHCGFGWPMSARKVERVGD